MQTIKNELTIGTTFSGIGAPEEALRQLGLAHKVVFACDVDNSARASYLANNELDEKNFFKDIVDMDVSYLIDQVDLYVGGSPCQSFSRYGKQLGLEDERGNLFKQYIKIIEQVYPKYFIWENVSSVVSNDKGKSWSTIKDGFRNLRKSSNQNRSYYLQYITINASELGFPQNRSRIFVIGSRCDNPCELKISKPRRTNLKFHAIDRLEHDLKILKKYPPIKDKKLEFVTSAKCDKNGYTRIHNIMSPHSNDGIFACQTARQITNWHGNFVYHPLKTHIEGSIQASEVYSNRHISIEEWDNYLKIPENQNLFMKYVEEYNLHKHEISLDIPYKIEPSLTSRELFYPNLSKYLYTKYNGRCKFGPIGIIRQTSPRENLNLMGFSNNFKIASSDAQTYKQAGNSMVVDVIKHLIEQIFYPDNFNHKSAILAENLEYSDAKQLELI